MLNIFLKNVLDSCDLACAGSGPVPDLVGSEMGLARPDLAQAWASSGPDLFVLVYVNSLLFQFEPE